MGFSIYTYGGGEILWRVFNGVSMVFGSSTFMKTLLISSLALGTISAVLRNIYGQSLTGFIGTWVIPVIVSLNLLFLPKTSVHIIDKVDSHFHYAKVDHVPLGLALIPSWVSKISLLITTKLETVFTPVEELQYGQTGLHFAARLLARASEAQLADSLNRENTKNFISRCFLWPFVYGNCKGLKSQAQNTSDILGFIKAHPHSWLGLYWKHTDGHTEFVSCQNAVPLVERLMLAEAPKSLGRLASKLLAWDENADRDHRVVSARLSRYMPNAWTALTRESKSAHEILQQFVMLNTYCEAKDDEQQRVGLKRTFPHLTALEASRAQAEQSLVGLIKGDVAGSWIPTLQVIFMSILIALFILVMPFTFLPGGFNMLKTWVKLMVWVQTWPIFLSLLNAIGLMFLTKAVQSHLIHLEGVNILTQSGLQDTAYQVYAWMQGLQLAVPPLSWAILSGSGYALSALTTSLSNTLESVAARGSTEVVEGNLSFDNQSFGNRTAASASLGQQTWGPHMALGQSLDTGSLSLTYDPSTGQMHTDQKVSTLNPNFQLNQALQSNLSESYLKAQTQALETRQAYEQSLSSTLQKSVQLGEMMAQGRIYDQTLSSAENLERQQSFERMNQAIDKYAQQHSIQDTTALKTEIYGELGIGTGQGGLLTAQAGLRANWSQDTSTQNVLSRMKEQGLTDQDVQRISAAYSFHATSSFQAKDESSHQLLKDYRASHDMTQAYQDQYHSSLTQAQTLQSNLEYVKQHNVGSTLNMNDYVLSSLAQQKFGGDVTRASVWAANHEKDFDRYGQEVMRSYVAKNFGNLNSASLHSQEFTKATEQAQTLVQQKAKDVVADTNFQAVEHVAQESWDKASQDNLQAQETKLQTNFSKQKQGLKKEMKTKIQKERTTHADLKERLKNVKG